MIREEVVKSALKKVYEQRINWGFIDRFTVDENAEVADALEKQIPKKPWRDKYRTKCYNCKHNLPCVVRDGKMKYCPYCGQAIDWSGENDD